MSRIEKLIDRFKSKPKNFTYNELQKLLNHFGYIPLQARGSRIVFVNEKSGHKIKLHKPHPGNILKRYQLDFIEEELRSIELL
ncbi:MAG: type II toxin-antitoxin system HicA family toxin [Prolixibacteraceae bacterium]